MKSSASGMSAVAGITILMMAGTLLASGTEGKPMAPPEIRSGRVEADGGKLFYERTGKGRTVVLLHDGLLHRETWARQMEPLAASCDLVRYDRRGYGRSETPQAPYSNVADLLRLLDALKIPKAVLVGCSAGGGIAIDFALEHPDRVEGLVLEGAVVSGLGFTEHFMTRGGHYTKEASSSLEGAIRYWAMEDPYSIAPAHKEAKELASDLLTKNPQDLDLRNYTFAKEAKRPAIRSLGEIRVPALVIVGDADIPDVHAHAGAIEAGIPKAKRVVVAGAGHLVHLEDPEKFNELVLGFLKSLP